MSDKRSTKYSVPAAARCAPMARSGSESVASSRIDLHEARLIERDSGRLAQDLRCARLTLVYGAAGCGKTTLLKAGLLPVLQRRSLDRSPIDCEAANQPRGEGERRKPIDGADRSSEIAEIVVFLDSWGGSPVASLQARIGDALSVAGVGSANVTLPLGQSLAYWSGLLNTRFLLVLDRFDEYLATPVQSAGVRELSEELLGVLEHPDLPANLLLCMRDQARPMMTRIGDCLSAFQPDVEYTYARRSGLVLASATGRRPRRAFRSGSSQSAAPFVIRPLSVTVPAVRNLMGPWQSGPTARGCPNG